MARRDKLIDKKLAQVAEFRSWNDVIAARLALT
jgi:hypothetical protein